MTIGTRNKTAPRASLRGMAWVNQFDKDTCNFSLVSDELAQLAESPRLMSTPLAISNRSPRTNASQILKGDSSLCVLSLRHKSLANGMVGRASEACFPTRQFFKMFLSRLSSYSLKGCFNGIRLFPNLIHRFPRVKLTIGVNGDIDNTEVNPQGASRVIRSGFRGINNNRQIESAVTKGKVGLLDNAVNSSLLVFPNSDRDNQASLQSQDRDSIQALPGEDTLIVDHCRMWLKVWLDSAVSFIGFGDLANGSDSHLSGKPETSNIPIDNFLETHFIRRLNSKGSIGNEVTGFIASLHCLEKRLILLFIGGQFNHQGLFHSFSIASLISLVNSMLERRYTPIPPTTKVMGFLGVFS